MIFNSEGKFDQSEEGFAQESTTNNETDTEMVSSEWELFSSGSLRKVRLTKLRTPKSVFAAAKCVREFSKHQKFRSRHRDTKN